MRSVWVLLVPMGWVVAADGLTRLAVDCVQQWVGPVPVQIHWLSGPRQLGSGAAQVRCLSDSALLQNGRFVFEVWEHGQWVGRFVLSGLVRVYAAEARLLRPVEAGVPVREVEQSMRWMSLAEYWRRLPPEEVSRVRARRKLGAGRVLLRADCLSQAGVRRGERITLRARVGAVEVRTVAQALDDGEPGSWIRVRRDGASRILSARVVDAHTAEVGVAPVQP